MSDRTRQWIATRWGRIARRVLLVLVACGIGLGTAEGAFRCHLSQRAEKRKKKQADDGRFYERYRHLNRTLYRRSRVPGLVYEPRPKAAVKMEYGLAAFNAAGLRDDREYSVAPTPGKIRVAVLGDSLVWGEFLPLRDSIPRAVGRALGARYEALNFGVTGYDTVQEALWYEHQVRRFGPAVVVVVYCLNDMLIMSGPFHRYATPAERGRVAAQDRLFARVAPVRKETIRRVNRRDEARSTLKVLARLRSLWRRWKLSRRYVDEYTVAAAQPDRARAVRDALGRLGRAIRGDGARALLVISPVLESWHDYHWSDIHRRVTRWGTRAGFQVVDPLDRWRARVKPQEIRIPGDNLHYNAKGATLLGQTIAEAVRVPPSRVRKPKAE